MFKNKKLFKIIFLIMYFNFINLESQLFANQQDVYKQLNLFGEVYERVRNEYVEKPADKDLIEAAINGMLQSPPKINSVSDRLLLPSIGYPFFLIMWGKLNLIN